MNEIAAQLGEVGLPAPLSELAARDWDAVVVGGGHNGLTAAAYLARAGQLGARARAPRAPRRRLHARAPVPRRALRRQPVRVRRRPARRARDLASSTCAGAASSASSPTPTCGSRSRTARRSASGSTTRAPQRNLDDLGVVPKRHRRATGPTSTSSTRSAAGCAPARATPGSARPRRAPRSRSCSTASRRCSTSSSSASIAEVLDDYMRRPAAQGRALRPGRDRRLRRARRTPAPPRSSSCTTRATSRARARCGATSRAAWGWSASRSPTPRSEAGRGARLRRAGGRDHRPERGRRARGRHAASARAPCSATPTRRSRCGCSRARTCPADYRERLEAWKVRSPVVKFNAALNALPDWTAAPGETLAGARDDRRHRRPRGRPARLRGVRARRARRRLRRGLHPDRLRPVARAGGPPPAERLRPVRALRARATARGTAAARRSRASSST